MLEQNFTKGADDALAHLGLKLANVVPAAAGMAAATGTTPGLLDRAKSFGMGQVDAAKSLFHNMRGGLGGQASPDFKGNLAGVAGAEGLNRAAHRQQAVGNLKSLAPTLIAGGGMYLLHKRKQEQEAQAQAQQQAMMQQGYGHPSM